MYCLAGTAYFRSLIKTPEEIRNSCLEFAIQCGFKINEEGIGLVSKNMCYTVIQWCNMLHHDGVTFGHGVIK
jgi:hypothetical protein